MKKNIMFIIGQMKTGGAEKVVCNLCNNLKNKYNITLVVRTMKDADYIPDVNIIEIPELGFSLSKYNLIKNVRSCLIALCGIKKLRKLKKDLKIDTSVSFLIKSNIFNYFSKYKDKVIISVRNRITSINIDIYKKIMFIYRFVITRVNLVVSVSESVMNEQITCFNANKTNNIVIPNFCEYKQINKLKKENLPLEHKKMFDGKTVISSGRYTYQKGQWHLIRAFKKVVEYDKDIKLVLTGRGDLKDYYLKLVSELNLQKNVFVLDYVDNVYRYMYNAQVYVLNSFYEGMPNALLEAMACNLPIIATDAPGGTREIVSSSISANLINMEKINYEDYGILIKPCDSKMYSAADPLTQEEINLADAIITLLSNKSLMEKYKKNSNKRIKDFDKSKILAMWESIL